MSLQLPELLAAAQQAGQGGPPPVPAGLAASDQADQTEDPLQVLQECIQQLPKVIAALPDPQDTQDAIGALQTLAKIQTRLMARSQSASASQG